MKMDENLSHEDDEVLMAILVDVEGIVVDIEQEEMAISSEHTLLDLEDNTSNQDQVLVANFEERRQQKFLAQSRTKKQWLFITLSVVTIFVISVFLVLESPIYDVDKVVVKNNSSVALTEPEIKKVDSLIKKLKTRPMYRLNADDVLDEIKSMSTISSVSSKKTWPGTLTISIFRRVPVAYIETDKAIVLVDSSGYAYEKVSSIPAGLPSFDGINEITFTRIIKDDTYVKILKAAPAEIIQQIGHVRNEEGDYIVELTDGIDIILGDNQQLKEKLAISWSVILTKKRSELGYIDVSVPTLPVSGSPELKV